MKKMKLQLKLITPVVLILCMAAYGFAAPKASTAAKAKVKHPTVAITMKDGGTMTFELYPEYAPITVANFIKLAKSKFYDGLKFHRIMKGFMVQGGDPLGTGMGSAKETIKGEFSQNGFTKNILSHKMGVISMARGQSLDSASCQFFICDGDASFLDGGYAAFGKLISGQKTLDAIANTPVSQADNGDMSVPMRDVIIKKIVVLNEK